MIRYGFLPASLLFALAVCSRADAQTASPTSQDPGVRAALASVARMEPATIEEQIELCQIPAPPFKEQKRAEVYAEKMRRIGLKNVRIDAVGNVIGERPGASSEPLVIISAHLDTVFPEGTDVTVTRTGTVLKGPGIGDDCRGLAVVLAVARALDSTHVAMRATLMFVGTVGEEGLGDLRGVRHLITNELKGRRIGSFVSVDGTHLDLVKDAIGSHRYRVTYKGTGGHSYGAFGIPNPIHALGRAIAGIADLQVPVQPKVTFNVGTVEGGTSVNSIAGSASMLVDMRSIDAKELDRVDTLFHVAVRNALTQELARWKSTSGLEVEVKSVGLRPGGGQPADAPVAKAALSAATALGFTATMEAASTDANIAISMGIPAVTIGAGGDGRGEHSLAETYDTKNSQLGSQWVLLFAATLANGLSAQSTLTY